MTHAPDKFKTVLCAAIALALLVAGTIALMVTSVIDGDTGAGVLVGMVCGSSAAAAFARRQARREKTPHADRARASEEQEALDRLEPLR